MTTWQLAHIFFTELRTFMDSVHVCTMLRLEPAYDTPSRAIGGKYDEHPIAGKDPDIVHLHLPREVRENRRLASRELYPERQARQGFQDFSFLRAFRHSQIKTELMLIVEATERL